MQEQEWNVRVELPVALTDDQAEDVAEALVDQGASVLVRPEDNYSSVSYSLDAPDLTVAVQLALQLAAGGLPDAVHPVGIEVITGQEQERRLGLPQAGSVELVDLVNTAQAGEILGVSRQRVVKMARDLTDFPPSAGAVGHARQRLWPRRAIEEYARARESAHPGRVPFTRTQPSAEPVQQ